MKSRLILLVKIYFCRRGRRSNLDNGKKEPPQSFYQRKLSRKTSLEDRERSKRRSSITSVPASMKDTNLNRQTSNSLTSLPRGHLDKRKTKEPKNHNKKIRSHENLHSTKNSKQSSGKKLYRQKTVSTSQDFLHSSRHIGIVSIVVYFYSTNAKRCFSMVRKQRLEDRQSWRKFKLQLGCERSWGWVWQWICHQQSVQKVRNCLFSQKYKLLTPVLQYWKLFFWLKWNDKSAHNLWHPKHTFDHFHYFISTNMVPACPTFSNNAIPVFF